MDRKSESIEWEKFKTSGTAFAESSKCFHRGLGSTLQWDLNRGDMAKRGTGFSHKFLGTIGRENYDFHIYERVQQ